MKKYLIRLDDACPYMDRDKWGRAEDILSRYNIRPLVGVIPDNQDSKTMIMEDDGRFQETIDRWKEKGWSFALHGYNHVCGSQGGLKGLNPFWKRSEYAGLPLEVQKKKIQEGLVKLRQYQIEPEYFFAPSHTFDSNTLETLRQDSQIRIVSDTIAFAPYRKGEFVFIPQVSGHCSKMSIPGIYTFCLHPNSMKEKDFVALDSFCKCFAKNFISFDSIRYDDITKGATFKDWLFKKIFFLYRKVRGLK